MAQLDLRPVFNQIAQAIRWEQGQKALAGLGVEGQVLVPRKEDGSRPGSSGQGPGIPARLASSPISVTTTSLSLRHDEVTDWFNDGGKARPARRVIGTDQYQRSRMLLAVGQAVQLHLQAMALAKRGR